MTVTNRKMFNRGARNKVRQMGGIMASSEPLIQEVARFQPGGSVAAPETMLGITLGGARADKNRPLSGTMRVLVNLLFLVSSQVIKIVQEIQ